MVIDLKTFKNSILPVNLKNKMKMIKKPWTPTDIAKVND